MKNINTVNYEDVIAAVLIDAREVDRKDFALSQYAKLNPSVVQLDVGDYVFRGFNGVEVVFEYKKDGDFLSSIVGESHHLHNQTYDMITHFDYTFIVVQCVNLIELINKRYYQTGQDISISQVNGAIAEFSTVSTVLFTQTKYQAFDLMMRVAGKIIQGRPFKYAYGKKTENAALNFLSSMSGVDKYAEIISKELNLKTLEDLFNLKKEDLLTIDGVGSKKADLILKNIRGNLHGQTKN